MTPDSISIPLRIFPQVQHDHWGRPAASSLVGALAGITEPDKPCAELWVGAHHECPSLTDCDGELKSLAAVIAADPKAALGAELHARFGAALPFLFKILSIGKPLSIQAHPDKLLAERLHREKGYPDANHKPEMAVALGDVSLLFGFRPLPQISADVRRLPELQACLGGEVSGMLLAGADEPGFLQRLYRALLTAPPDVISAQSALLRERLEAAPQAEEADRWVLRLLQREFPRGDVGVLSFYVLNLLRLKRGESVFIPANTIHAYLDGELAECMANSDNVVRAGLTPKEKDIDTLLAMLRYESGIPAAVQARSSGARTAYRVPLSEPEFGIDMLRGGAECEYAERGPKILLCVEGAGDLTSGEWSAPLKAGSAFFIADAVPSCRVKLDEGLCFAAFVPAA